MSLQKKKKQKHIYGFSDNTTYVLNIYLPNIDRKFLYAQNISP